MSIISESTDVCAGVSVSCGDHGRLQERNNGAGSSCECVCDEGWDTMQGGDVLMTSYESLQSTVIPLNNHWCSVNRELQGGLSTNASPTMHSQSSETKSGMMMHLEEMSWASLLGIAISVVLATSVVSYLIHRFGCTQILLNKCRKETDSHATENDNDSKNNIQKSEVRETSAPSQNTTHHHIHINIQGGHTMHPNTKASSSHKHGKGHVSHHSEKVRSSKTIAGKGKTMIREENVCSKAYLDPIQSSNSSHSAPKRPPPSSLSSTINPKVGNIKSSRRLEGIVQQKKHGRPCPVIQSSNGNSNSNSYCYPNPKRSQNQKTENDSL